MRIKLCVLFGGKSVEHEVSVISALQAIGQLDKTKYDIIPVYITKNSEFYTSFECSCIEEYKNISSEYDDIGAMIEMAEDEPGDEELVQETGQMLESFKKKFEAFRIETLLSGEFDECNAVVSLHAGAGGTESCDWASMLYRMYTRWKHR